MLLEMIVVVRTTGFGTVRIEMETEVCVTTSVSGGKVMYTVRVTGLGCGIGIGYGTC
jgi:hypothetical protein